jgi:imidazolonepropionase
MICSFCAAREEDAQAIVAGAPGAAICDRCVELAAVMVKERLTPVGDMVLDNIGTLATNDARFPGTLGLVSDAVVATRRGRVVWAGPAERIPQGLDPLPRLDCGGRAVIPGMIDAHTHMLFAGDRSEEFALRAAGVPPTEAAARVGGPPKTALATRMMELDDFEELVGKRLDRMLEAGTTTAEAAAGYTTDHQDELDLLEVAGAVNDNHPLDLVGTFDVSRLPLIPTEREKDLSRLQQGVIPEVAGLGYTIRIAYGRDSLTLDESRLLLSTVSSLGSRTRLHCEDTASGEPYRLALEAGATVVDHCGNLDRHLARQLGDEGIAVVATPITTLAERGFRPRLRDLIRAGVPVALGTDCSPAPVLAESLTLAISLAVLEMGLTPDQAVWSATRGGAIALGLPDRGWIGYGSTADLVVLDAPNPTYLSYRPGAELVWKVIKNGTVVASR